MKRWAYLLPALAGLLACLAGCTRAGDACLSVQVIDGFTDAPVAGAAVVVPETGKTYETDAGGRTASMTVPARPDAHFLRILPQAFGSVTVLVYADGYYTVALFHCRVEAGKAREDLRIRLFPNDGTLLEPFTLVESPDDDWVRALIRRFEPAG